MHHLSRLHLTSVCAAAAALLLTALPAQAGAVYSSLYVFGDSLSDAAGGAPVTGPNPLAPNEGGVYIPGPYSGGRVSNGAVAAEYLAAGLGLDAAHSFQFAIAGARSGADGAAGLGTGVESQIAAFGASGLAAGINGQSLFMVWSGANDMRDALVNLGPLAGTAIAGVVQQIAANIGSLYALGARNFLLPNLPDIGLTPEAQAANLAVPGSAAGATALSAGFNNVLLNYLSGFEQTLPGADFHFVDIFSAQHALVANAASLGLTDLTNGCLVPVAGLPANTAGCDASFYVDNIHPTTQVHAAIGQAMLVAAVPEPAALLLTGTAVLGLMLVSTRRRRTAPVAAAAPTAA